MADTASFLGSIRRFFHDHLLVMQTRGSFGQLVQQATEEPALRQSLMQSPKKVLAEAGITLPADLDVEIVENTDKVIYSILPPLEEGIEVPADIEVKIHENSNNKIVAVLPGPQVAEIRERTRLKDRGTLEPGAKADVNLIDYENPHVNPPELVHDLPAGMPRPMQTAKGYVATYVSGQAVQENGQDTGARPGKIVRAA